MYDKLQHSPYVCSGDRVIFRIIEYQIQETLPYIAPTNNSRSKYYDSCTWPRIRLLVSSFQRPRRAQAMRVSLVGSLLAMAAQPGDRFRETRFLS